MSEPSDINVTNAFLNNTEHNLKPEKQGASQLLKNEIN